MLWFNDRCFGVRLTTEGAWCKFFYLMSWIRTHPGTHVYESVPVKGRYISTRGVIISWTGVPDWMTRGRGSGSLSLCVHTPSVPDRQQRKAALTLWPPHLSRCRGLHSQTTRQDDLSCFMLHFCHSNEQSMECSKSAWRLKRAWKPDPGENEHWRILISSCRNIFNF